VSGDFIIVRYVLFGIIINYLIFDLLPLGFLMMMLLPYFVLVIHEDFCSVFSLLAVISVKRS
jgi:hypothetical protein